MKLYTVRIFARALDAMKQASLKEGCAIRCFVLYTIAKGYSAAAANAVGAMQLGEGWKLELVVTHESATGTAFDAAQDCTAAEMHRIREAEGGDHNDSTRVITFDRAEAA